MFPNIIPTYGKNHPMITLNPRPQTLCSPKVSVVEEIPTWVPLIHKVGRMQWPGFRVQGVVHVRLKLLKSKDFRRDPS